MCWACADPSVARNALGASSDEPLPLFCVECPYVTAIPDTMNYLRSLNCRRCKSLSILPPTLTHLRSLICSECPLLAHLPSGLIELTDLFCDHLPLLTTLPMDMTRLETLSCEGCTALRTIPDTLVRVQFLWCDGCPALTRLPNPLSSVNITVVSCKDCPLLYIPLRYRRYSHSYAKIKSTTMGLRFLRLCHQTRQRVLVSHLTRLHQKPLLALTTCRLIAEYAI